MRGKGIMAGIGIALAATVAQAQQFDVSIMPLKARTSITFKGDQFADTASKGGVGVAVSLLANTSTWPPRVATLTANCQARLCYSYTPGASGEVSLSSPPLLVVNGKDFSSTTQPSGQGASTTNAPAATTKEEQIFIEWTMKPSHLLELEVPLRSGLIRPLVVIDCEGAAVSATGKIDGKLQTATEEFSRTFVGFGARARSYASRDLWVDAGIALGSGYENAEVSASVRLARDVNVGMGYRHRVLRFQDETTVRSNIGFGEIGIRF